MEFLTEKPTKVWFSKNKGRGNKNYRSLFFD